MRTSWYKQKKTRTSRQSVSTKTTKQILTLTNLRFTEAQLKQTLSFISSIFFVSFSKCLKLVTSDGAEQTNTTGTISCSLSDRVKGTKTSPPMKRGLCIYRRFVHVGTYGRVKPQIHLRDRPRSSGNLVFD